MNGTWIMPALDAVVIVTLAAVSWRLRRDPHAQADWEERERRLQEIFERLHVLVAQSEGVARDLDGALDAPERCLRALVDESKAVGARAGVVARDSFRRRDAGARRRDRGHAARIARQSLPTPSSRRRGRARAGTCAITGAEFRGAARHRDQVRASHERCSQGPAMRSGS